MSGGQAASPRVRHLEEEHNSIGRMLRLTLDVAGTEAAGRTSDPSSCCGHELPGGSLRVTRGRGRPRCRTTLGLRDPELLLQLSHCGRAGPCSPLARGVPRFAFPQT